MKRVPEPELMDAAEQAEAYAAADFDAPNAAFVGHVETFLGRRMLHGRVLDLGCGPADICVRLARRHPGARFDAVDGSAAMLACARRRLEEIPAVAARIRLVEARLPTRTLPAGAYDFVISNSLLHHLHAPAVLWRTVRDCARPGAGVVVMDLFRPHTAVEAQDLVERYAAGEPDVLRTDFYNSLLAAFTPDEVRAQLDREGFGTFEVREVSDRHLLVTGRLP
jgi:SAM-dependent methyltransferase